MMIFFTLTVLVLFGAGVYKYYLKEQELDSIRSFSNKVMETNHQMYKTIAVGLYHRFKKEDTAGDAKLSANFIRNNPYEFEYFVADIMEGIFGGQADVTHKAGDFGIDIEHWRNNELYLIQVKCEKEDLPFEPVAILHSQMVKHHAKGGMIVATSGFSPDAKAYANEAGVELIDGLRLVHYWSTYLQKLGRSLEQSAPDQSELRPALT